MWKRIMTSASQNQERKQTVRDWLLATFVPGFELIWNAATEMHEKVQAAIDLLGWIFV